MDITMSENKRVVAVKKSFRIRCKHGMLNVQSHKRRPYERSKEFSKRVNSFRGSELKNFARRLVGEKKEWK